jgi:PTH1 family peptidyl-tRNA hydrolase
MYNGEDMFTIVGLGNPGTQYTNTRHNVGWLFLDYLKSKELSFSETKIDKYLSGKISEGQLENQLVRLFYPTTFMNNSGLAVAKLLASSDLAKLLVVHDDVALPLGTWRISFESGAGGHNGLLSLESALKTNQFTRLRIGIAPINQETGQAVRPTGDTLAQFVLGNFSSNELSKLEPLLESLADLLAVYIREGTAAVMNKYN